MFQFSPAMGGKIIVAICSIIGSGIISFFIGYYLGKRNIKLQEFYRASREFRDAFIHELTELESREDIKDSYTADTFSFNIVERAFEKHRLSVERFSNYLSKRQRKEFIEAWNEYAYPNELDFPDNPRLEYKTPHPPDEPLIRENIRKRINKILSFGKFK